MKKEEKLNKGITLVALVITIIILLLLVGIIIVALGGENGIFAKAKQAKKAQLKAEMKEQITIGLQELQIDKKANATLDDVTQDWASSSISSEYNPIVKDDASLNGKLIVMTKDNIVGNFLIDSNLNIIMQETDNRIYYTEGLEYAYDMKTTYEFKEYGAEFNCSNYLQTENIGEKYTGTNSKTLSTWFKTDTVTNTISGFAGIGTDGYKTGFLCGVKNGYLYFDTGYGNFIRQEADYVADGMWHNFIVTYDKTEERICLYLDGNKIYTSTGGISITDGPLLIGKSFSYCFSGNISNVRLYDRAVNETEISTLYNEGYNNYLSTKINDGLDYEYIMKNNENGTVIDTANSHTLTQVGNVNYYEKVITNIKNIARTKNDITVNKDLLKNSEGKYYLDFYNNDEYYQTSELEDDYLATKSKTLMAWFKTDTVTNTISGFVGIGTDGYKTGFLCGVKNGYLYFDTGYGNFIRQEADYVADGKWHHFAVSYAEDSKEIKLYLDGEKIYEDVGDINTQKSALQIGKSFGYTFNGQVTDVKLYNKSVDDFTISYIYNIEK